MNQRTIEPVYGVYGMWYSCTRYLDTKSFITIDWRLARDTQMISFAKYQQRKSQKKEVKIIKLH